MPKLLYIQASPRGDASRSVTIANRYLESLQKHHTDVIVETLELWNAGLPEFDGNRVAAKLTVFAGQSLEKEQVTLWDEIKSIAEQFLTADHYMLAVPMWNGGIPYKLKQYIDLIHQPGITFNFDPAQGYIGLLQNKRATLVYTSAAYSPGCPTPAFGDDYHSTYLRHWLRETGVTEIEEIRFQPTMLTSDPEGDFTRVLELAEERGRHG